jgi:hypothetical protein
MFLNLLIPKEKIIGIEINSQKLRMLKLELSKSNKAIIKGSSELELEDDLLSPEGIVNEKILNDALSRLIKAFKPKKFFSPYAIITVPQIGVYSEILELPKSLDENQLAEAIALNAAENLPLPLSRCYVDWQIIKNSGQNYKILASIISKKIADKYINALKNNGIKLVALETSFLSIERVIDVPDSATIFLYLSNEGLISIIYKNKISRFNQFESWKEIAPGKEIKNIKDLSKVIKNKIKKLKFYFESQNQKYGIENILLMSYGFDSDIIIDRIGKTGIPISKADLKLVSLENYDWIPVAGAAVRALIPRSEDAIISLLPVGTESLYETQKAVSFAKSILFLLTTLLIFYIITFSSAYFAVSYFQESISAQMNQRNNIPISQEYSLIRNDTDIFNSYLRDLDKILNLTESSYSSILENINKLSTPGINMSNLNFDEKNNSIIISGIAANRESLNIFRSRLGNSSYFNNLNFSIKDISKKDDIPFSANLKIK